MYAVTFCPYSTAGTSWLEPVPREEHNRVGVPIILCILFRYGDEIVCGMEFLQVFSISNLDLGVVWKLLVPLFLPVSLSILMQDLFRS